MITKNEALKILKQHKSEALRKEAERLLEQSKHVQISSVDQITDRFPRGGACYWTLKGNREDYWYAPVEEQPLSRGLQTGGDSYYHVISKETGEVSGITLHGE
jgi:hypothetical protein